jgi:hypothetical protein
LVPNNPDSYPAEAFKNHLSLPHIQFADTGHYNKSLLLVSFDMEKFFDQVWHHIIIQALRAFGFARVINNGYTALHISWFGLREGQLKERKLYYYKTGSGQGDLLSSTYSLLPQNP